MAQKRTQKKTGTPRKRRKLAGHSIGLLATELSSGARQAAVDELQAAIESDGGRVLATYREPFSGHWVVPPGRQENRTLVTEWLNLRFDTTVHYIAVHLHPFAESLELRMDARGRRQAERWAQTAPKLANS